MKTYYSAETADFARYRDENEVGVPFRVCESGMPDATFIRTADGSLEGVTKGMSFTVTFLGNEPVFSS